MVSNSVVEDFRHVVTAQYYYFEGRTRRRDFWRYALACFLLYIAAYFVDSILGYAVSPGSGPTFYPLTSLLIVALLLPSLGILARRLQDTGHIGWWALIGIIPVLGWIVLLYWCAQPGTKGENKFGPDPKAAQART